mmetsp:Transcript_5676/g.4823  ORF Transcript_5676/g.4823 Transcript_5676/m.4823 type:complete len:173 (+) Transcript_5676:19-537(+)
MDSIQEEQIIQKTIIHIGRTGSGKSYIANQFLGKEAFVVGHSVKSETFEPQVETFFIEADNCTFQIDVADTPGTGDNRLDNDKHFIADLLQNVCKFLKGLQNGFNLTILCVSTLIPRIDESYLKDFVTLNSLLGSKIFDHSVIALTQTNLVPKDLRAQRVAEYTKELPNMLA